MGGISRYLDPPLAAFPEGGGATLESRCVEGVVKGVEDDAAAGGEDEVAAGSVPRAAPKEWGRLEGPRGPAGLTGRGASSTSDESESCCGGVC